MSIADQAIFESILQESYRERAFPEFVASEIMEFHAETSSNTAECLESPWESTEALTEDRSLPITPAPLEVSETQLLGALSQSAATRRGSITFVNPFQEERVDIESLNRRASTSASFSGSCSGHAGASEVHDTVYPTWTHFQSPGNFMSGPRFSHHDIMDGVYQDMNQHVSRRFSALPTYENQITAVAPSSIQFVIEDPSGKENTHTSSNSEHGRRHSVASPHLYCCPWPGCNKVFNRFYNLRSHYRIHSGEKPFTCNFCEASFARNHDLKRHERIHSNSKPFVCTVCNKAFSRNDAMNRHVRLNSCSRN